VFEEAEDVRVISGLHDEGGGSGEGSRCPTFSAPNLSTSPSLSGVDAGRWIGSTGKARKEEATAEAVMAVERDRSGLCGCYVYTKKEDSMPAAVEEQESVLSVKKCSQACPRPVRIFSIDRQPRGEKTSQSMTLSRGDRLNQHWLRSPISAASSGADDVSFVRLASVMTDNSMASKAACIALQEQLLTDQPHRGTDF
jgi:hypothetical protein